MAYITSCEENENGKYKLIDDNKNIVKIFTEDDEPVDFNVEVEKFKQSFLPTNEDRIRALEDALIALTAV